MKEKSSHTIFHPTLHDPVLASFPTQAESKGDGLYRRPCTLVERELCGQPPDLVDQEAVISASETRTVATTAWTLRSKPRRCVLTRAPIHTRINLDWNQNQPIRDLIVQRGVRRRPEIDHEDSNEK